MLFSCFREFTCKTCSFKIEMPCFKFEEKNLKDLESIERRVGNIKVSMLDAKELYDLKGHVGEVRGRLNLYS